MFPCCTTNSRFTFALWYTFFLDNDFPILFLSKPILLFSLSFCCSCFKIRNCKVSNIVLLDKMIFSSLFSVIPLLFVELWKSIYCIPNAKYHTIVFPDKTYFFLCRSRATPYTDAEVKVMQFICHAIC